VALNLSRTLAEKECTTAFTNTGILMGLGHSIYTQVSAVASIGPYTKNEASANASFLGSVLKIGVRCLMSKIYGVGPFYSRDLIMISDKNLGLTSFRDKYIIFMISVLNGNESLHTSQNIFMNWLTP